MTRLIFVSESTNVVNRFSSFENWIHLFIKIEFFIFINLFCSVVETSAKLRRFLNPMLLFWLQLSYFVYFLWTISMIMSQFMIFKTIIIFFIFLFRMRALVARLRVKMIIWLIIFFEFIEITSFVRLLILIKLIIEEFFIFILIIIVVVIFARAIQYNFLHNNFK